MTYRCFNSFEELADFQRQQDADIQKSKEDWIKQNPYMEDPLSITPYTPSPFHRIYDRGEGIDVPLEELIESAKEEINMRTKNYDEIDPVQNIRIYQDDYENGDYNLRFYGEALPRLIKEVRRKLSKDSPVKSYQDLCEYLDSSDYYVGRSEDDILGKLADLPLKDKAYYKAPSWRLFKRHLKDLDKIFADTKETPNRQAARVAATKCISDLNVASKGKRIKGEGIRQGFDLAARLGDYLGYDMSPLLSNLKYAITDMDNVGGSYNTQTHTLSINPRYTSSKKTMCGTILHEVFHAIDDRLDLDSVMDKAIPSDPATTEALQETIDQFAKDNENFKGVLSTAAYDETRINLPEPSDWLAGRVDPYSALMYLTKFQNGDREGYKQSSEFISTLLGDYMYAPNRINKKWLRQVLTAFRKQQKNSQRTAQNTVSED